ncbi:MAG: cupredoxin domain-containing protein [Armatimonadota bacterium]|nr:cupredoxin domain-containing protein [Armatimonadota bacterium]
MGQPPRAAIAVRFGTAWSAAFAIALAAVVAVVVAVPIGPGLAAPAAPKVLIKARDFSFDPKEVTVRAGDVTFEIKNEGSIEHNFIIEDGNRRKIAEIAIIEAGKTDDVKATVRPGNYAFVCTLPGHREAGMVGVLRAQP